MPKRNLRNSWLYIGDATSSVAGGVMTGNYVEVKIGEGNVQWTEAKSPEYQLDRGRIIDTTNGTTDIVVGSVITGDEQPMDISFDIMFEYYSGTATINPIEALKGVKVENYDDVTAKTRPAGVLSGGALGNWVAADTADPCAPWSVNIFLKFDPICGGVGNTDEWIKFPIFRWENLSFSLSDGQISVSGKSQAVIPTFRKAGDSTWT